MHGKELTCQTYCFRIPDKICSVVGYFLLCFTSTEMADIFHSCNAWIIHQPVFSQIFHLWQMIKDKKKKKNWQMITHCGLGDFDWISAKNIHEKNSSTLGQATQNTCRALHCWRFSRPGQIKIGLTLSIAGDNSVLSRRLNQGPPNVSNNRYFYNFSEKLQIQPEWKCFHIQFYWLF